MTITKAERQISIARTAARRAVAAELGGLSASGNLAADRIADQVLKALSYRDPDKWPTRDEVQGFFDRITGRDRDLFVTQVARARREGWYDDDPGWEPIDMYLRASGHDLGEEPK